MYGLRDVKALPECPWTRITVVTVSSMSAAFKMARSAVISDPVVPVDLKRKAGYFLTRETLYFSTF